VLTIDAKPAGLHAMAWLPDGLESTAVSQRTAAVDIETPPLTSYSLRPLEREGLVLG